MASERQAKRYLNQLDDDDNAFTVVHVKQGEPEDTFSEVIYASDAQAALEKARHLLGAITVLRVFPTPSNKTAATIAKPLPRHPAAGLPGARFIGGQFQETVFGDEIQLEDLYD